MLGLEFFPSKRDHTPTTNQKTSIPSAVLFVEQRAAERGKLDEEEPLAHDLTVAVVSFVDVKYT